MDSIIPSALEEICSVGGETGVVLKSLWPKLKPSLQSRGLDLSPGVKNSIWTNLLAIPTLQFQSQNHSICYTPTDQSIQSFRDAEKLNLKIVAKQQLRDCFIGLYDIPTANANFPSTQRSALDRIASTRTNGIIQRQLGKEFGIEGRNLYYVVESLEKRGLIVRQSAVVRTKEASDEGESKKSSCVSTNLLHLHRYAKHLDSQQKFEITEEVRTSQILKNVNENAATEDGFSGECVKDDVNVKDYLPAMKAVCDKLEKADAKVLAVSDIKRDLGYCGAPSGHKAWKNICDRLKAAHIVEGFGAKVSKKVECCLRLCEKLSPGSIEPKSSGCADDACNKEQRVKFGRKCQITDQLVELPIDQQIYDMIDAAGSKGLPFVEVCMRLGIDKKKNYSRLHDMCSRFRMHCEAENNKKSIAFRVWTCGNFNPDSSDALMSKSQDVLCENKISNVDIAEKPSECDLTAPGKMSSKEIGNELSHGSPGNAEANHMLQEARNIIPDAGVDSLSPTMETNVASSEITPPDFLKPIKSGSRRKYPCLTTDGARREQRILERLQDEKVLLKAELYRWLVNLEKDKCSTMDRKTIDRILNNLQQQGHCKIISIRVPFVSDYSHSRINHVVLHPSIQNLSPDRLSEIHNRLRSFERQSRAQASSRWKSNEHVPVLNGIQRTKKNVVPDTQAIRSEVKHANGFTLGKMVCTKLLHYFLWGYLNSLPAWNDALSCGEHMHDIKFDLEAAFHTIPLELFFQLVGSSKKLDDVTEKRMKGLRLSDLPTQEYKNLKDSQATQKLSSITDVLLRLKLIRLVCNGHSDNAVEIPHATLTYSMELKPYIEEPLPITATSSNFGSLDLRPQIRHDFILSNKEAVDAYWQTLEYSYATADRRAALHAFPGSAVHEVLLHRSWASVRGKPAYKHAALLKRVAKADSNEKLPYKEYKNIAKNSNLTLQQAVRVRYDKHQYLNRFQEDLNDNEEEYIECKHAASSYKRKISQKARSEKRVRVDDVTGQFGRQRSPDTVNHIMDEQKVLLASSLDHDIHLQAHQEDDHLETVEEDPQESELVSSTTLIDNFQNRDGRQCKSLNMGYRGIRVRREVDKSLAVSNAVELIKLVFLSTSKEVQNLLAETLRRYSERELLTAFSYLKEKNILIGDNGNRPRLSKKFLYNTFKSPFPINTGKRAARFSSCLTVRERDLMEGGIIIGADLHCGDIFHLFALASSGEFCISSQFPDEGIGEAEDLKGLKRRLDNDESCDGGKAKKLNSRREKGFPGIMLSMRRATIARDSVVELFKDEKTCSGEQSFYGIDEFNTTTSDEKGGCPMSDHMKEIPNFGSFAPTAEISSESPWEAMTGYAEYLMSIPCDQEHASPFYPEIFRAVYTAIQQAGDQGLGIEEVSRVMDMSGEKIPELIIDVLQAFGQALKVNAYDSIRVVDAIYRSKYFFTTMVGPYRDLKSPSLVKSLGGNGDGHLILEPQKDDIAGANSCMDKSMNLGYVCKISTVNLPKEAAAPLNESQSINAREGFIQGKIVLVGGDNVDEAYKLSSGELCMPILPWINGDGTINRIVYKGLVRRVLGTVMQKPGILEDDIIREMDVLNPQSCRQLLELMIQDKHLMVRKMQQTTSGGAPALLGSLLGSKVTKSKFICRDHFFANPMSTSFL